MKQLRILLGILSFMIITAAHAVHVPHILNYHRIGERTLLTHSPDGETLHNHILGLTSNGYTFTTSRDFMQAIAASNQVALLTFDDGHESVISQALPVLAAHGVTATAYIITDVIGQSGYLTEEDIRRLHAHGWEIGSHTSTHAALTDLVPASINRELMRAYSTLEQLIGERPACLAYPYGLHDALVREITREHHDCAFTTSPAASHLGQDSHGIPRPPIHPGDNGPLSNSGLRGKPLVPTLIGLGMLTWPLPDGSPINAPPSTWNPTRYRTLGDGHYNVKASVTGVQHELSIREGPWVLHLLHGRGTKRAHAIGIARNQNRFTLAGTYVAGEGPGLGVSYDWPASAFRVKAWTYWTTRGGTRTGVRLIPRDYVAINATYHHGTRHATFGISAPLNIPMDKQAYPLRLHLGYDKGLYAGASFRAGGNTIAMHANTAGTATLNLEMRW